MKEPEQIYSKEEPTSQEVQALLEQWRSHRDAENAAARREGPIKLFGEEVGGREHQIHLACDRLAKDAKPSASRKEQTCWPACINQALVRHREPA